MAGAPRPQPDYVLGSSDQERRRLLQQAMFLRGWTDRFFRSAGLAPGMRVLDLGCGVGDVAFLTAEIVGPSGSVVGIDRDAGTVDRARERAREQGSDGRIQFHAADLYDFQADRPFDAVVGRYVLIHQPDPARALRRAITYIPPRGIVVFHEMDFANYLPMHPEAPLFQRMGFLIAEVFRQNGLHPDLGSRLVRAFLDAGLSWPNVLGELPAGGEPGSYLYGWLAEVVRSLLPRIEQLGLATAGEIQIDTLAGRMETEATTRGTQIIGPAQFGAWAVVQ